MTDKTLKDAATVTPDPDRAVKNLSSFLEEHSSLADQIEVNLRPISMLFSCSQFLANYSINYPDDLFSAVRGMDNAPGREELRAKLETEFLAIGAYPQRSTLGNYMDAVRSFRIREMLKITLRDIMKQADLMDIMLEMSQLADIIISVSLKALQDYMSGIYGVPEQDHFSIIALGKLGAEELNYSSDIDLMYVYLTGEGETSGTLTAQGVRTNRISNHEYYCKLGEEFSKFLSQNTPAGFAYRVDLRLRPEGQRGALALSLGGYEEYYESWGRAWERAMLLRARPVAGDHDLGRGFIEMIKPFVYRKYLDFSSIDEIRKLKTRIDSTFKKGDIKRGYGGIREIEFFAQALQLIYGGREPLLRERNTVKVLHLLLQKGLIGQEDYSILSENYRYLRTVEHRLQQVNDLQTHTIPSGDVELSALARKMAYPKRGLFVEDLEKRRARIRDIYDSLFATREDETTVSGTLFDDEFTDADMREFVAQKGLKDPERAVNNIKAIKYCTYTFQTLRGRRALSGILPRFVDSALKATDPDAALNHLRSFAGFLSANESYLEIFGKNGRLIDTLTYVFSHSDYLTKMLMSRPKYLEMIGWQELRKKSLAELSYEIASAISEGQPLSEEIRVLKQTEEIRLGLMFIQKKTAVQDVVKGLSKTAEAILRACMEEMGNDADGMAVIGFGKLGGREIAFNSDLDVIFVSAGDVTQPRTRAAERFLRMLISYTRDGVAYRVDTRLRPEGSKGPLVSSVESFRKYYTRAAAFWEFQALLKARPVAGSVQTGKAFIRMAKEILIERGGEVLSADIRSMRDRIKRELSKEAFGYDIKLGPGGIEEIEFTTQYLQLVNCRQHNELLVQGTVDALGRLGAAGVITRDEEVFVKDAYLLYRTLDSFLRLRSTTVLEKTEEKLAAAAEFMGFTQKDDFVSRLELMRKKAGEFYEKYVADA